LKFSNKPLTLAVDGRKVIVRQAGPSLFHFAAKLVPIGFDLIPSHLNDPFVSPRGCFATWLVIFLE
jgi:hypothetical protein